jgi:hypothetical protein
MLRHHRCVLVAALVIGATVTASCAADYGSGPVPPDRAKRDAGFPQGWGGGAPTSYVVGLDRSNARTGSRAVYIASRGSTTSGFATITQLFKADDFRGHRIRWSGWVRRTGITGTGGGLWMRVDGPGATLSFDNMLTTRPIVGTKDWEHVFVVLDVPPTALGIACGVLLTSSGDLVVDDLTLEIVDDTDGSTNLFPDPVANGADSAAVAASYATRPRFPVNLGFEGF